ncbi:MAG: hypothetical protein ACOCX5_04655, partial [Chloroflexota bacterium]
LRETDKIQPQFANLLLFRPADGALSSDVERARNQPVYELVDDHTWQKKGVVQDRRCLKVLGHQPADLKYVLMKPLLHLPHHVERDNNQQAGDNNINDVQL